MKGKDYYFYYDPPHLLKSIRNNVKSFGFNVDGEQVNWDPIVQLFKIDQASIVATKLAPKLTTKHITLPPFMKMNVPIAAQTMSRSVASGILQCIQSGQIPEKCAATAKFINHIDDLFDCTNSRTLSGRRPIMGALTPDSCHKEFLEEIEVWLEKVKPNSPKFKNRLLPCQTGWLLDVKVLLDIIQNFWTDNGLSFLLTSRFNQDPLENLFSIIRGKGGHRCNPDAHEFRVALTQVMVDKLLLPPKGGNCQPDMDSILFSFDTAKSLGNRNSLKARVAKAIPKVIQPLMLDGKCSPLSNNEENTMTYIAGWIAFKIKKFICENCYDKCTQSKENVINDKRFFLMNSKQYECLNNDKGLTAPSDVLLNLLVVAEKVFKAHISKLCSDEDLRFNLLVKIKKATESRMKVFYCDACDLYDIVINLFLKCRLHFYIKLKNREMPKSYKKKLQILRHE